MTYKKGGKYQGEWANNKINGYGFYFWDDGSTFEGEFVNGLKSGTGIFTNL